MLGCGECESGCELCAPDCEALVLERLGLHNGDVWVGVECWVWDNCSEFGLDLRSEISVLAVSYTHLTLPTKRIV